LPSVLRPKESEGKVSLDAERTQLERNRARATGRHPIAASGMDGRAAGRDNPVLRVGIARGDLGVPAPQAFQGADVLADGWAASCTGNQAGGCPAQRAGQEIQVSLTEIDAALSDLARGRWSAGCGRQLYGQPADYWIRSRRGRVRHRLDPMGGDRGQTRHVSRRDAPQDMLGLRLRPARSSGSSGASGCRRAIRCGVHGLLQTRPPTRTPRGGLDQRVPADLGSGPFGSVLAGWPAVAVSVEMSPPSRRSREPAAVTGAAGDHGDASSTTQAR